MVKPKNPEINLAAQRANAKVGYGPGNPEPISFKTSPVKKDT